MLVGLSDGATSLYDSSEVPTTQWYISGQIFLCFLWDFRVWSLRILPDPLSILGVVGLRCLWKTKLTPKAVASPQNGRPFSGSADDLGPRTDCAKTRILVPHDLGHTDIPSNDLAWVWVKVNPRFVRRVTDGCIMLAHQSKKALVFI
jgi:hypothetical protein